MLKLGLPRPSVLQALERDGKDVRILDLDPDRPLSVQQDKLKATEKPAPLPRSKNAALEGLFAKRAAVQKEFDAASQPTDKKAALEAMLAKRAAALDGEDEPKAEPKAKSKTAALEAMFAKRAAEMGGAAEKRPNPIPIRNDPEFKKYFKMLKVGMPIDTVRQALERDGKDPAIADFDPDKSYASQAKEEEGMAEDVPLKDDPNYKKFFKVSFHAVCHLLLFVQ
ncbi:hypothetical protein THAOC_31593 [Thalassiosira oceanica]|uniref:Uncharacterized protein n=1 Tax=Thalassiosira oceanica TaxID=159749 RepID=K0RB37_THAOC|nr:hypothetical protein THAOC_31593 [Thalassiosira oceanica]|eukprot:EJK49529.1 hypothetical protein THAOC_31593 [Thalassiosira oceanica]